MQNGAVVIVGALAVLGSLALAINWFWRRKFLTIVTALLTYLAWLWIAYKGLVWVGYAELAPMLVPTLWPVVIANGVNTCIHSLVYLGPEFGARVASGTARTATRYAVHSTSVPNVSSFSAPKVRFKSSKAGKSATKGIGTLVAALCSLVAQLPALLGRVIDMALPLAFGLIIAAGLTAGITWALYELIDDELREMAAG